MYYRVGEAGPPSNQATAIQSGELTETLQQEIITLNTQLLPACCDTILIEFIFKKIMTTCSTYQYCAGSDKFQDTQSNDHSILYYSYG